MLVSRVDRMMVEAQKLDLTELSQLQQALAARYETLAAEWRAKSSQEI